MRWLAGLFIFLILVALGGLHYVRQWPHQLYSSWIAGRGWTKYYSIEGYKKLYLLPTQLDETSDYREDYPQLWRSFPLRNSLVPLPTRHPLYLTVPLVELRYKTAEPSVGMIITGPDKREISTIYTLPTTLGMDYTRGQELFKLPFIRNRILKLSPEQVWKEIFTRKIDVREKSPEEMIHDLYILHIRSKLLPKGTITYGLQKDGKAVIELRSRDKDYMVELVLTEQNGSIFSYVLKTALNRPESIKLRSKYLKSISFSPVDPDMGRILYTEFKQLSFARQMDQEGLLYLFSAWTQQMDKIEILKEMIYYLERGRTNTPYLKALYRYAFIKYGKTFTTRNIFTESDDANLLLQRKIELEDIERNHDAQKDLSKEMPAAELTTEEKMNAQLKKAKEAGPLETEDMTVH